MAKKDLNSALSPALQFITPTVVPPEAVEEKPVETPVEAPTERKVAKESRRRKVDPYKLETKSKRLQLLIKPTLYDRLKDKAYEEGISVNELVHEILDDAVIKGGRK